MDAIDKAIRNAFEKGDPLDPAFRGRVYRSVTAALERSLAGQSVSSQAAEARRADLRARIEEIETEFVPAVEVDAPVARAPLVDGPPRRPGGQEDHDFVLDPAERELAADRAGGVRAADRIVAAGPDRPRGGALRWIVYLLVAALAGLLIWWALSGGLPSGHDTDLSRSGTGARIGASPPGPDREAPQDWVTVFSPDNPARVAAIGNAEAELREEDGRRFLRMRTDATGPAVTFEVGQGILEWIKGRNAVFVVVARAEEGEPTQISVTCDFGALGACGRQRYELDYEPREYPFDVSLPDETPQGGGTIAIISDIGDGRKAADIHAIQVRVMP